MTYAQTLFLVGLAVIAVAGFLVIRIVLDMRQRIVITVARPTTSDGESVQISANIRAAAGAPEIAAHIEKASLAIQGRMVKQNELVTETDAKIQHQIWLRIREKLDVAEKEGRRGVGILNKEERKWWLQHQRDYDEHGPIIKEPVAAEG